MKPDAATEEVLHTGIPVRHTHSSNLISPSMIIEFN